MDIDIDLQTTFDPLNVFKQAVAASIIKDGKITRHPCGAYLQTMPKDPVTGLSAIPYKQAEQYGFTKIDFLHLNVLDYFDNKKQIRVLINTPPKWGLLLRADVVGKLFQLNNNVELVRKIQPRSIIEIADCISLIRPGKLHLMDKYLQDKDATRLLIYRNDEKDKYSYKKGHAISYAMIVVLQLHLIDAGIL
jgi:DNA polymerase III alpha subunit